MYKKIIFAGAVAIALFPASASTSDADAVAAGKVLAAMWRDIPANNFVALECNSATLKLLRIRTDSLKYDVVRSDSLVSPYKIIIDMIVSSQTNEPNKFDFGAPDAVDKLKKQVCYKSIDDAKRHTTDRDFAEFSGGIVREYPSRLVYGYSDEGYRLLSAAPTMTSVIIPGAFLAPRNAAVWGALVSGR